MVIDYRKLNSVEFLKNEVEFLGFIVSVQGIKTNPKKVEAIASFPSPRTLKDLRSFLSMSGYYWRFIKDYANIAKPLTSLLRGEDGRVSQYTSKNKQISLDKTAIEAYDKLKNVLISEHAIQISENHFN